MEGTLSSKVEQFLENREEYERPTYNEASTRGEFIDHLFRALGWDVHNEKGLSESLKDVVVEASHTVDGRKLTPDYSFRLAGVDQFFVEAKKPYVNLVDHAESALQVRRYCWSAGLPVGILTDFAEFAVYDCRVPPSPREGAGDFRLLYVTVSEYEERWGELEALFSRDAVAAGSLRVVEQQPPPKRKVVSVNSAFLNDIERWRLSLATDIYSRNSELQSETLSYLVQATLDRIIFLRISEDRGIESGENLLTAIEKGGCYSNLLRLFHAADERYNSGLFHFKGERGRSGVPDAISANISIGDDVIRAIVEGLYPPRSPYAFSTLSAEILGQVYEQFLGRVISIVHGSVRVDEKPEVKKAGGVVYTPAWVVRRMVGDGLVSLLNRRRIENVRGGESGEPLRILDPACGSGSFLIQLYDGLLNWYLEKYKSAVSRWSRGRNRRIFESAPGEWRLTVSERKEILLRHIYGVDIDPQAVEVTKLSLLLKVLEGETLQTLSNQLSLFNERALPDLGSNIRCGNTLVGGDFYQRFLGAGSEGSSEVDINPFDWKFEFPFLREGRKFDLVIGNPPYLSYSGRQAVDIPSDLRRYFQAHFTTGGWPTAHGLFIERAVRDLSADSTSFIIPDQVGHLDGYRDVRGVIGRYSNLVSVHYMGEKVFPGRTTPALVFRTGSQRPESVSVYDIGASEPEELTFEGDAKWVTGRFDTLKAQVATGSFSLGRCVGDPGVHTGNSAKKIVHKREAGAALSSGWAPVLEGKDVDRWIARPPGKVLDLSYVPEGEEYFTIRTREKYASAEFVIRQTAAEPIVARRANATYFRNTLLALYSMPNALSTVYAVALLNSMLLRWYYRVSVRESQQKAFPQVKVSAIRALPLKFLDLTKIDERRKHDDICALAEQIEEAVADLERPASPQEAIRRQRRRAALEEQLDELVFDLYGLTQEDRLLVREGYDDIS